MPIAVGPQKIILVVYSPGTKYYEVYDANDSSRSLNQDGYVLNVSMAQEKYLYSGTDQDAALAAVKKQAQE